LKGVDAVIDKDLAASLLARLLRADMMIITTAIERWL
jgi:carbamate kinase